MSLLEDVAGWAAPTHGAIATDLFEGQLPDSPDDAIGLVATGGGPTIRSFGRLEWQQPTLQVFVRRSSTLDAEAAAEALWRDFDAFTRQVLGGTTYVSIRPIQPPYKFDVDAKDRVTYAFNVEVVRG